MINFFQSYPKIRRKTPEFHRTHTGIGILDMILGFLLWVGLLLIFCVILYTQWFTQSLVYLLQLIKPKPYRIPFWFSFIIVILTFPFNFGLILFSTFLKIVRG